MAALIGLGVFSIHAGATTSTNIKLKQALSGTYYVKSQVTENGPVDFLIDTGSSYTILDELVIEELMTKGLAHYKRDITGTMADGSQKTARVYLVKQFLIGDCHIKNVEVVAFEPKATFVLGINALKQLSPFSIDTSTSQLTANCRRH